MFNVRGDIWGKCKGRVCYWGRSGSEMPLRLRGQLDMRFCWHQNAAIYINLQWDKMAGLELPRSEENKRWVIVVWKNKQNSTLSSLCKYSICFVFLLLSYQKFLLWPATYNSCNVRKYTNLIVSRRRTFWIYTCHKDVFPKRQAYVRQCIISCFAEAKQKVFQMSFRPFIWLCPDNKCTYNAV